MNGDNKNNNIYPNGLNMFGNPVRCMECDSLYHLIGYCPFFRQRNNNQKEIRKKMLEEIIKFEFIKKEKF